jgi:hypothetical protein
MPRLGLVGLQTSCHHVITPRVMAASWPRAASASLSRCSAQPARANSDDIQRDHCHSQQTAPTARPRNLRTDVQIIILVLSQDEALAKTVHKVTLTSVPWYKERRLSGTTLGSLLFIVLLRAAHRNLLGPKDVYQHSNTLAALANLAPHSAHLSPHATQRLILVIETSYKRLRWLSGDRVRHFLLCCSSAFSSWSSGAAMCWQAVP